MPVPVAGKVVSALPKSKNPPPKRGPISNKPPDSSSLVSRPVGGEEAGGVVGLVAAGVVGEVVLVPPPDVPVEGDD